MSESLAKALLRRHPDYEKYKEHWEFLESCYEGGREWFDDNLFQYWKEGEDEFEARKKRAYRFNHSREVVDLVNKYLFRAEIKRREEQTPDEILSFWQMATREGLDIDYYMRQISKKASIFGRVYIVVDSNRPAEAANLSVADAVRAGIRTYSYTVSPIDVLDMSFDDMGRLNWILIRETVRDDADFVNATGFVDSQYRVWTRNDWALYRLREVTDETARAAASSLVSVGSKRYALELKGSGVHGLGEVPVIIHDNMEHDSDYYAPALINDIAYQDRAVANYLSNLDAIIQDQTFSQLAIPAQALMPGEEESAKSKLIEMGTKRIFLWNAEAGTAPMFLSPDPKQAEMIIIAIRQVINEIYHSVGMAGERTKQDNSMGIDNSSGVAKAYDFERINALLSTKAQALQRVEYDLVRLVCLWNGIAAPEEQLVKYADQFDVRGLADEFDIAQKLSLVSAPATARRAQMRRLLDKVLPTIGDEDREAIEEELEDWPVDPLEMISAEAGVDPTMPTQGAVQPETVGEDEDPEEATT